jgi:hypothetical protein
MTKNIHKEIKFKSNLGFGTVSVVSLNPMLDIYVKLSYY